MIPYWGCQYETDYYQLFSWLFEAVNLCYKLGERFSEQTEVAWRLEVGLTRPHLEVRFPRRRCLVRKENSPQGKIPRRQIKLGHRGASAGKQAELDLACVPLKMR